MDRTKLDAGFVAKLESAIADVQLFGTTAQLAAIVKIAEDIRDRQVMPLQELTQSLRDELRKEVGLEHIDGEILVLRFP